MTSREQAILEVLAALYPASAQASGGRPLRLRPGTAFPELDRSQPDQYESFLEAAESLETEGVIAIEWERHRRGEEISSLVLINPESVFRKLNRPFLLDVSQRVREESRAHVSDNSGSAFFAWLAEHVSPKDIAAAGSSFDERTIADTARLIQELDRVTRGESPQATTRALSVRLFSDSKHIEQLLALMGGLLRRAERNSVPLPLFDLVDRSYPEAMISGRLRIETDTAKPLENDSGMIMSFPFESIIRFTRIKPLVFTGSVDAKAPRVLGVENKETFYVESASTQFDAVVYVAGHPNRAVQALFRIFALSGWDLYHFGDLDPDGILILQELADAAGKIVQPWMMNRKVFEKYESLARPLDKSMHLRAALIRQETRALPGIEDLLSAILSSARGVEQEIIEGQT